MATNKGVCWRKYPFLLLNIVYSKIDTIIIIDGNGFKKGALDWLKNQVNGYLKKVISLTEFIKIANEGFLK